MTVQLIEQIAVDSAAGFEQTYEQQTTMIDKVKKYTPDAAEMQNAGDTIWRKKQTHRPVQNGWDSTGNGTDIISEGYYSRLGVPVYDKVELRIDDVRDGSYVVESITQMARRMAGELNARISTSIAGTGTLFSRYTGASGAEFAATVDKLKTERQLPDDRWCMALNPADYNKFSAELSSREYVGKDVADAYRKNYLGKMLADFDIYKSSAIRNLVGGASPDTTVPANQSFAPEGGVRDDSNLEAPVVTNNDYRYMTMPFTDASGYAVGDVVKFVKGGTDIQSLGLGDKNPTNDPATAKIVAISGNNVTLSPKFIAADDAALSTLEKAYANVDTTIDSGTVVERLNTSASVKPNLFWHMDSIEVLMGEVPLQKFGAKAGNMIEVKTESGLMYYILWDFNTSTKIASWEVFTWYGITNCDPMQNGLILTS